VNELFFVSHIFLVVAFALLALRYGKSSLIAFIALQAVLANLFVVKQMSLFGFAVTCSDVFAIGGILALNLLQEYFGKEAAQQAVRISFLSLIFFACMSQLHLFYAPTPADQTHSAFQAIFASTPRIVIASMTVFYLVQKIDIRLFGYLKLFIDKLPLRIGLSLLISQFLDTVLFSFLALYGLVESLFDIIFVSFFIKCLIIATSSPLVAFSKRVVKRELSL